MTNTRSRTHCAKGHEYTADNSFIDARGRRYCNVCRLREPLTHCRRGHPIDDANTYLTKSGRRLCHTCKKEKERDWYRRHAQPKAVRPKRTPPKRTTTAPPPAPNPRPVGTNQHTEGADNVNTLAPCPAVTLPDTAQCQRCGLPADHNTGTPDAICDPCQTRQQRRAARQRYARLNDLTTA